MQIDIRVVELLSSKICHDLISPVGAINNGVELVNDVGGGVVDEAMKLIGDSAGQASRKLRLFRLCYGRAGSEGNLTVKDARSVVEEYLEHGKIKLSWPAGTPSEMFVQNRGALKLLINTIMLAEETLAYGGSITVAAPENPGDVSCKVEAAGRGATVQPVTVACLDGKTPVEEVTPRTVHAYIVSRFSEHFGIKLKYNTGVSEKVTFVLSKSI
ncbi:MAG: hypothetical protein GC131_04220 [Alphaproteobacteria bacterium]|nr:hypothetical protein [Alphaproteobacteria bacterium]